MVITLLCGVLPMFTFIFLFKDLYILFCVLCVFLWVYVNHMCAGGPQRPEEGIGFSDTMIIGNGELLCGCWQPNPDPLQEQQALLTPEPSLLFPYS